MKKDNVPHVGSNHSYNLQALRILSEKYSQFLRGEFNMASAPQPAMGAQSKSLLQALLGDDRNAWDMLVEQAPSAMGVYLEHTSQDKADRNRPELTAAITLANFAADDAVRAAVRQTLPAAVDDLLEEIAAVTRDGCDPRADHFTPSADASRIIMCYAIAEMTHIADQLAVSDAETLKQADDDLRWKIFQLGKITDELGMDDSGLGCEAHKRLDALHNALEQKGRYTQNLRIPSPVS